MKRLPWNKSKTALIFERDNHECIYCGGKEQLALDHIIPFSAGGPETAGNIAVSCKTCNSKKHKNRLLPNLENYILFLVCERNSRYGIDPSLILSVKRGGFRNCLPEKGNRNRAYAKYHELVKRIDSVDDLYTIGVVNEKKVLENVTRAIKRRGLEILAIPNKNGEKVVFLNGDPGFVDIPWFDAVKVTREYALSVIDEMTGYYPTGKVSGNLGLKK